MFDKEAIYKRMLRYGMKGALTVDAPLARVTSFRIGGPADIFFAPENYAGAVRAVKLCRREGIPLTVLGNGTNVLVRDGGVRGIVMTTAGLRELRQEKDHIFAAAGAPLREVCEYARRAGLSGLEFARGIPGTAGGAVFMNAGAYGSEMKDAVCRSAALDMDGDIGVTDAVGHGFAYRESAFQKNGRIILETEFSLRPGDAGAIAAKMDEYDARRAATQPLGAPSAGSVFRRPAREGVYVGPLIEQCGLKGACEGGAQVSEKHAGFIINLGGATASDVLSLIDRIRGEVYRRHSIDLTPEIRVIGEDIRN